MSSRHKRPEHLSRPDLFVIDAERITKTLMNYAHNIDPASPHHHAVMRVHAALLAAVREITGAEAPWMVPTPASWGPRR
jgi:hypothetical protein